MDPFDTFEHAGLTVELRYEEDTSGLSPREWSNLGIMLCSHSRYSLGDESVESFTGRSDFKSWRQIARYLGVFHGAKNIIPLGLLDHSGISMYAGGGAHHQDPGGWDSGTVGVYFTTDEKIAEIGTPPESIDKCLREEIDTYDDYLCGDVYYFRITNDDDETLDTLGGIYDKYPYDYLKSEARAAAEACAEQIREDAEKERAEADWAASHGIATVA